MMQDAFSALYQRAAHQTFDQSLWFVDENYDVASRPLMINVTDAITNRIDIADYLAEHCMVNLSDYDCASYADHSIDAVYLRVPKSKALLNHMVRESLRVLKPNGRLICVGFNDEGIKNTFKKIEKATGELIEQELLGKGLRIAEFSVTAANAAAIEDRGYQNTLNVANDLGLTIVGKAGVYGAEKIDAGSAWLCDVMLENLSTLPNAVLDLGCGNGLIALRLAQHFPATHYVATDNNVTAVEMCRLNFAKNGVQGEVILADCGQTLADRSFEMIVCNPPFHQGFDTSEALTLKFLATIERLLTRKGQAWLVMNRFLKVEHLIKGTGLQLTKIDENHQFKILKLNR